MQTRKRGREEDRPTREFKKPEIPLEDDPLYNRAVVAYQKEAAANHYGKKLGCKFCDSDYTRGIQATQISEQKLKTTYKNVRDAAKALELNIEHILKC